VIATSIPTKQSKSKSNIPLTRSHGRSGTHPHKRTQSRRGENNNKKKSVEKPQNQEFSRFI